jgi:hypothetical protein
VFDKERRENEVSRGQFGGCHAGPSWSRRGGDMEKRAGGWARWASCAEVRRRESRKWISEGALFLGLHKEGSLSMPRTTRYIAAKQRNSANPFGETRKKVQKEDAGCCHLRVRSCP